MENEKHKAGWEALASDVPPPPAEVSSPVPLPVSSERRVQFRFRHRFNFSVITPDAGYMFRNTLPCVQSVMNAHSPGYGLGKPNRHEMSSNNDLRYFT